MTDIEKAVEEAKAAMLPFESWERLKGESSLAFAAFCTFRDFGPERNIRKAVDSTEKDVNVRPSGTVSGKTGAVNFAGRNAPPILTVTSRN